MFGSRWNSFDDVFNFQREVDRLFNQFWSDLPTRAAIASPNAIQVNSTDDGWRIDVPLPGIDPANVSLDVAGNTLSIRAEETGSDNKARVVRYEQTLTVPQFLDLDKIAASHRHGLLSLTLPLKESLKPRRVQIASGEPKKQLAGATA
jgi:HSP20 family protein